MRDGVAGGTRVIPFLPGSYRQVLALQHRLVDQRSRGLTGDVVLLGEHERVVTLGRGTRTPPAGLPLPVVEVERGGEATWHGPGQLVGYPILELTGRGLDVRRYLRELERALGDALSTFGLTADFRAGATGVWVGDHKVASLGIAVRRHVTYHGFALNVAPALADFAWIRPCGFDPEVMTSMERLLGRAPALAEVAARVLEALVARLRLPPPVWEPAFDSAAADAAVTAAG